QKAERRVMDRVLGQQAPVDGVGIGAETGIEGVECQRLCDRHHPGRYRLPVEAVRPVEPVVKRVLGDALRDLERHYPGHRRHIAAHDLSSAEVVELLDTDDMAERYLELIGEPNAPYAVRRALAAYFDRRLATEYEAFVRRYPAPP